MARRISWGDRRATRPEACCIDDARAQIEALFRRYAAGVGGYVLARTADAELAEAITARVFCIVVRKFDQCRGAPVAWLWSIVRSELARHFRERRPHAKLSAAIVDGQPTPQQVLAQRERQARLHAALEQLPPDQHEIVFMKFFQDMTNLQIAEALDLTASNVGVRVHRTLRRLRELMGEEEADASSVAASPAARVKRSAMP